MVRRVMENKRKIDIVLLILSGYLYRVHMTVAHAMVTLPNGKPE